MLRRKPSKIEVKAEDKEEIEETRRNRASTSSPRPDPNTNPLRKFLDPSPLDAAAKAQRIGLHQP